MTTKLIVLGDSIMTGWNGSASTGDSSVVNTLARLLGWQTDNKAIGGTKFTDNRSGNNDFPEQVEKFNFRNYDAVLLGYGINDFDDRPYATPLQLTDAIKRGVAKIRRDNPAIQIYGELPTASFVFGSNDLARNGANYTQREIFDTIKTALGNLNVPTYDWREAPLITYENRMATLGDGTIHPNAQTQTAMGERLAYWIKQTQTSWNWLGGSNNASTNYNAGAADTSGVQHYDYVNDPNIDWGNDETQVAPPMKINKTPIVLDTIAGLDTLNATFNNNVKKIVDTITMITQAPAGSYDITLKTFDTYNRAFRNYLISMVLYLKNLAITQLG